MRKTLSHGNFINIKSACYVRLVRAFYRDLFNHSFRLWFFCTLFTAGRHSVPIKGM